MNTYKYINIISMMVVSLLAFTSCDLDEYNPSGATADAIWSTPEGFVTLVNAAYHDQRQWYGKEDGIFMGESGTDLWINENLSGYARQLSKYEGLTPADGNPNKKAWQVLWMSINHTNAGINRIDQAGFTNDTERNERLGELRFLRAFYYWHLVETFGGVMLRTESPESISLTAERSPVEDFYNLMEEDLIFASENLPIEYGDEYSRATKKSALGMLARVYLSRAYYGDDSYFGLARDVANEVIDNQAELGVALWDTPQELWDPNNNKRNKEALYVVSNSTNTALNFDSNANRLHLWYLSQYSTKPGLQTSFEYGRDNQRRLMPTLALLDMFDESMDARYAASFREVWISNSDEPFEWTEERVEEYGKDPSLIGTVMQPGQDTALYITKKRIEDEAMRPYIVIDRDSTYHTDQDGAVKDGRNYPNLIKFQDPYTRVDPNAQPGFLDIMVIRLAEMYLIAAEAELQLGNAGEAANHLNVLRERAAVPGREADMRIEAGDVDLDFILDERARELCGELVRWFDLKRTRTLLDRVNTYNPDITEIREHHILRPVPQAELDALQNGDEFGQNDGYN